MKIILMIIGVLAAVALYVALKPADPVTLARLKCEMATEHLTSYDVPLMDVTRAFVDGDVHTGIVRMPFSAGNLQREAVCVFRDGSLRRFTLDRKLLAGQ